MTHMAHSLRKIRPGYFARSFSSAPVRPNRWTSAPAPPRLPKEEQEIFERLQQQSTGAFSTPRQLEPELPAVAKDENQTDATAAEMAAMRSAETDKMLEQLRERARVIAKGDGEELHPNIRRGAPPEFEGEVNPKTGEVGGPKNEPLRWGVSGDWSYNGRVTDF